MVYQHLMGNIVLVMYDDNVDETGDKDYRRCAGTSLATAIMAQRPGGEVWRLRVLLQLRAGCRRLIGEVVQSRRQSLLGPSSGWKWLLPLSHLRHYYRHYAKRALTPRSLNMKLGPWCNYHKGRAAIRHYANRTASPFMIIASWTQFHVERLWGQCSFSIVS